MNSESQGICIALDVSITARVEHISGDKLVRVVISPHNISIDMSPDKWRNEQNILVSGFNRYVLAALYVVFRFFGEPDYALLLTIDADSRFYSNDLTSKTGLGSSAATVVACISALVRLRGVEDDSLIFKLGAIAHSFAQGRVGSCFDVATAIFGTGIFRRPSAKFLCFEEIEQDWDWLHEPFTLPPGLAVVMVSVSARSSCTVELVGRVLSRDLSLLKTATKDAISALLALDLGRLRAYFARVRFALAELDPMIVPKEIEEAAERLEKLPGVVAVSVPGAGGFDSLAVVTNCRDLAIPDGMTIVAHSAGAGILPT